MSEQGPQLTRPTRITDGEYEGALQIGSRNDKAAYWYVPTNEIVITDEPEIAPEAAETHRLSAETVGEYIRRTGRDGAVWSLNRLGEFLRNVASFEDVRILTLRQEEVYALCRIAGMDPATAAELLDISESLLADHLSVAQKKITCAFNLVEAVNRH